MLPIKKAAASRVADLSDKFPARLVVFDLLAAIPWRKRFHWRSRIRWRGKHLQLVAKRKRERMPKLRDRPD